MRTVFNSNSELASVFASQNQFQGRANNLFFERDTAYSYGYHFTAAKFITANNGEKICFINKNTYSSSTGRHLNILWRAIPKSIKIFSLYFKSWIDRENLPQLLEIEKKEIEGLLKKQLNARLNTYYLESALRLFNQVNEISELFGLPKISTADFDNWIPATNKAALIKQQTTNKGAN